MFKVFVEIFEQFVDLITIIPTVNVGFIFQDNYSKYE